MLNEKLICHQCVDIPYSDKFRHGYNLAQLAQNGKNHQIKPTPNLLFFSLRQI